MTEAQRYYMREYQRRRYQDPEYRAELRQKRISVKLAAMSILGDKCACCGSIDRLCVDHIVPTRKGQKSQPSTVTHYQVLKNPIQFQLLCYKCNRWKSDGPQCPCKWWDSLGQPWR